MERTLAVGRSRRQALANDMIDLIDYVAETLAGSQMIAVKELAAARSASARTPNCGRSDAIRRS